MDHHKLTLEQVARVEKGIGIDAFVRLSNQLPEIGVKYGDKLLGQVEAILNMVDPMDQEKLLAGEASIEIIEIIKSLFDNTSRVIPPRGFKLPVTDENRKFYLDQHVVDHQDTLKRLTDYLHGYKYPSLSEFQDKCESVKEKSLQYPRIGENAFNRCYLPLPIPHIPELSDLTKLGKVIEDLLEGVGRAYKNEFPDRTFYNHRQGTLAGEVSIVSGTRHGKLLEAASKAPQSGIFLPDSLQGYSIHADRKIISLFPNFVSLSGIEYIFAMIAYPDILARDYNTPGLDMAALFWRSADYSLLFEASDDELSFGRTGYLAVAYDFYSGGLLFLG
ncbi:hypothetical protein KAI52_02940 [Candidatus Parcubacteria bacterium]|nr:hypothetical protein [Candidatus Parcubacteria bacterium]